MTGLPILDLEQVRELLTAANGNAVSYIDSPSWSIGERRSTFMMRDGFTYADAQAISESPTEVCGSMSSLAYSCRDKCRDYLDALYWIEEKTRQLKEELLPAYDRAAKRNQKRAMKSHSTEISWCNQDIRNCKERAEKLKASYFRGYEGRFLVS